jgi:energy-coupling factor transporter ATP-binding protein EcfA2
MSRTLYSYCISGLAVRSEIALPGLNAAASDRGQPDVTIRRSPVPAVLDGAGTMGPTWQIAGKQFLLRIPNVARFLLSNGQDIAFEVESGGDVGDIPIFLLGTVFGILLHQRERIVLHASAVRVNGKAVLFCGSSGQGKSTLAAALTQRGYPLITDDVCAITVTDVGTPMAHPDGRHLKLWTQAIENLDLKENRGARVRSCLEKYYVDPGQVYTEALPLGIVYALREAQPSHPPGIERPNVVDASLVFRRNAYRPMLVSRMGQKANYFQVATTVADKAGIFFLTRALEFTAIPKVVSWLERHWSDIDLMETAA